jgi:asparagine synthase (glutamine-hydrolysing)
MRDKLPEPILTRRKMGFPVPLKVWFASEFNRMAGEVLLDPATQRRGLFKADCVERILREHKDHRRDFSEHIWLLMNLELWHRQFLDRPVTAAP